MEADSLPPPSSRCWTDIVQKPPPQKPQEPPISNRIMFDSCKSSKGVAVAVVDANAIIQGGEKLASCADKFVSVREVLEEVRDPVSRRRLDFLPFTVETMEPSPDALKKVINFAKATGDLQTLSDVDLKLIALTYMLEAQFHGTNHLRDSPPSLHMVNVKRLPEKEMPGWGSNVPNLAEWEALENDASSDLGSSRILPLKDLSLNVPMDGQSGSGNVIPETGGDAEAENQEGGDHGFSNTRRFIHPKKEIKIEGKKMVADGIDASQGEAAADDSDWMPAVSRSTHRRYIRRKARRESAEALEKLEPDEVASTDAEITENAAGSVPEESKSEQTEAFLHESSKGMQAANWISKDEAAEVGIDGDDNLSTILKNMRLEEESSELLKDDQEVAEVEPYDSVMDQKSLDNEDVVAENRVEISGEGLDHLEISSQTDESIDTSQVDDNGSEQSWMLRSLSDSSVACVTSDFAMQNVILQIGLRLLAPGGMQIRQLHRWILKCHACNRVTAEIGRIFCPKCGNGGTLRKVSVTVGENGVVLAARRPRITLRGTKFSLPLPQGGREAITKNLILREDQLPQKLLYPKFKKKPNKQGVEFLSSDDIFSHTADKRAPLKPPVRKALAVFSGRRNPNDNHFSRSKH
ncbi:RNA-binding NOB1-like protein [Magnolia sinica]|uniref:RNA-binding NOB1-like protein n=1 Tax=Magnolia sinica TaxID=86752 RepID=UPI00265B6E84|nr:RNA-binding NOB1-like protein [Magnolia sinica]